MSFHVRIYDYRKKEKREDVLPPSHLDYVLNIVVDECKVTLVSLNEVQKIVSQFSTLFPFLQTLIIMIWFRRARYEENEIKLGKLKIQNLKNLEEIFVINDVDYRSEDVERGIMRSSRPGIARESELVDLHMKLILGCLPKLNYCGISTKDGFCDLSAIYSRNFMLERENTIDKSLKRLRVERMPMKLSRNGNPIFPLLEFLVLETVVLEEKVLSSDILPSLEVLILRDIYRDFPVDISAKDEYLTITKLPKLIVLEIRRIRMNQKVNIQDCSETLQALRFTKYEPPLEEDWMYFKVEFRSESLKYMKKLRSLEWYGQNDRILSVLPESIQSVGISGDEKIDFSNVKKWKSLKSLTLQNCIFTNNLISSLQIVAFRVRDLKSDLILKDMPSLIVFVITIDGLIQDILNQNRIKISVIDCKLLRILRSSQWKSDLFISGDCSKISELQVGHFESNLIIDSLLPKITRVVVQDGYLKVRDYKFLDNISSIKLSCKSNTEFSKNKLLDISSFPNLKSLTLKNLSEIDSFGKDNFEINSKSLSSLHIDNVNEVVLGNLPNLKMLSVASLGITNIQDYNSLESLNVGLEYCSNFKLVKNVPNLKKLIFSIDLRNPFYDEKQEVIERVNAMTIHVEGTSETLKTIHIPQLSEKNDEPGTTEGFDKCSPTFSELTLQKYSVQVKSGLQCGVAGFRYSQYIDAQMRRGNMFPIYDMMLFKEFW